MKIVVEIQKTESLAITPPTIYDNDNQAEAAYHTALSAAAVSTVPVHSVVMLNEIGELVKRQTYYHQ